MFCSTALIPIFLKPTLSSEAISKKAFGFFFAISKISLFSSLELKEDTEDPTSTLNTASAWSISISFAAIIASSWILISSNSSLATTSASHSAYIMFFFGWYNDNNFCKFCFCFETANTPSSNIIWPSVTSPFWSFTSGEFWLVAYLNSCCSPTSSLKYNKGCLRLFLEFKVYVNGSLPCNR